MKKKKSMFVSSVFLIGLAVITIISFSQTPQDGFKRTELQRNDLSVSGREVIQVRVDIDAGLVYPKHKHPGEEIVYVTEGIFEYHLEGKSPVIVKAGEGLFIPYGTVHSVKNIGKSRGSEIATYIVEKGKPLISTIQ
jgi:quercetin dioxygenase-like cupin family protein